MIPCFATTYFDDNNKLHLYVFPGVDDNKNQLFRNIDLSNLNNYTFIKNDDKSYDFTFKDKITHIVCTLVHIKTGEIKKFEFNF